MAVITTEDFMAKIQTLVGDSTDDDTLAMLGDFRDTLDANQHAQDRIVELETANRELDESWRKKYKDRFFAGGDQPAEPDDTPEDPKKTFDSLFE